MDAQDSQLARENARLRQALRRAEAQVAHYRKVADEGSRRHRRDVAQLKKHIARLQAMQKSLEESEERYRGLVELCPVPIIVHRDGEMKYFNRITRQILGISEKSCGTTNWRLEDFISLDQRPRLARMVEETRRNPTKQFHTTYTVRLPDRRQVEVEAISTPTFFQGQPARLVFCIDRTELFRARREKAELREKLNRSRKMEALGLLAGGVAHDLNNILSGILTYPEFILMDLRSDHRLRKPLETILDAGRRAAAVVQDLLTISRGVASSREVSNFNDIVSDFLCSPEYEVLADRYPGVVFETQLSADLMNVRCSAIHIRKSLMNLVINAAEALQGEGKVSITTENRCLDRPLEGYERIEKGEYAVLSVRDNGPGISPEDLERIFEPFYTRKVMGRSGTGLGLTVVWNTVQDHRGCIDVNSSPQGTTFDLYFPLTHDHKTIEDKGTNVAVYMGSGERILVVDDEENQRTIAAAILKRLGYAPVAVDGGARALEILARQDIDAVLLDMVMPQMDGLETYRCMLAQRPGLPCVIASGFTETEAVREAQQLGAGIYLKKPYTIEQLGSALKSTLGAALNK